MNPQPIQETHRQKLACIYLRQSTLKQVRQHPESTERQYALRDKALQLGWPPERILILDRDLGISGTQMALIGVVAPRIRITWTKHWEFRDRVEGSFWRVTGSAKYR